VLARRLPVLGGAAVSDPAVPDGLTVVVDDVAVVVA
jgi:hypothetical protein